MADLVLKIQLVDDASAEELEYIKRKIQDFVEDHDSGAICSAEWLEPKECLPCL